jgi:hypothetical protein
MKNRRALRTILAIRIRRVTVRGACVNLMNHRDEW